MYFRSPYSNRKVIEILNDQLDPFPSLLRCLITLNVFRFSGTSRVCGVANNNTFEIRNRKDPYFSLKAKGEFIKDKNGTIIKMFWSKPKLFFLTGFFKSYSYDKRIITNFLEEWLKIKRIQNEESTGSKLE
jgi:hypothetical protein